MQEIKYQAVQSNEDEPLVEEYLDQNGFMHFIEEWKRRWLLKCLFIFLVTIKVMYLINNFNCLNEKNIENNQTEIFENKTISERTFSDFLYKENHTFTTTLLHNNSKISTTTAIYDAINVNNYENNYENSEVTTTKMISDSKATTIHLNSININKTAIVKLSTETPINKRLVEITATMAGLQTTSIKTTTETTATTTSIKTTTMIKPLTTSTVKTPAVKTFSAEEQKYFINTSQCHIPFVEPFSPEIRKIFKPQYYTGCTKDQPIVTSSFNDLESHYILHINYTVAESLRHFTKKAKPIKEDLLCCYQEIIRSGSGSNVDSSFKLLSCTNFHQDFEVPKHVNGILVKCKLKSKNKTLQEDALSFVQVNESVIQQKVQNITNKLRKPSFLLIGIDTLSRINFRRNMPETFKYLVDNRWYELMGYNKVGDNTLPNLMPLLSGYNKKTVYKNCNPKKVGGFDDCNFIWTALKKNGYNTAYAEDSCYISTFNYLSKGFKKQPTDFYFRPMDLAFEKSLKTKRKAGLNYCVGRKQLGEYIYDYATEFATRFKNLPSFGFFWTNSFSHNSYDGSATMDKTMVKYFKEWKRRGIYEDSVVIFFSDHGARWGPLLKLSQGFLEERLPMFFISVPNWFRQQYPQLLQNLEINQKRLTNPFDIYMTFQHVLSLAEPHYKIKQAIDCPKCQSIFEEIPENRTCDDANIPEVWCTCLPFKTLSAKSEVVQNVTHLIIQEINQYYERQNLTSLCVPLQLKEILNAKLRYLDESKTSNNIYTYAIEFTTAPLTKPMTLFSATVDYDVDSKRIHLNVEDISRQSLYENTSKCTDDKQAKKYCICKNSFK